MFLEQALTAAGNLRMPVKDLLHPGRAGPRRPANEKQLAPRLGFELGLMFDPTTQQMRPVPASTGMLTPQPRPGNQYRL